MGSTLPPPLPIETQVANMLREIQAEMPEICRLAVASYDRKTDLLKTFVSSTDGGDNPLPNYEMHLKDVPSLDALAKAGRDRVVDDLSVFATRPTEHSRVIVERYGSSYTRPLDDGGRLRGFIFFDARPKAYFTPVVVQRLTIYAELMALLLSHSLFPAALLRSAVTVAAELSHTRDPETGAHLDRMSRYARTIAKSLSGSHGLSDAFIEHLFVFAPLHDVGKMGIPDRILLKKGRLTDDEMAMMQTHTTRGASLIDRLLAALNLAGMESATMLRNIVVAHHESWDGSGYPHGLRGSAIPIEARIVTAADVFDALTSARPYKEPWSVERAIEHMRAESGARFDPDVFDALAGDLEEIVQIKSTFLDEPGALRLREGYNRDL